MIIGFIIGFAISLILLTVGFIMVDEWGGFSVVMALLGILGVVICIVFIICFSISIKQVEFLNKMYGTNYTAEEYFYNESLIKEQIIGKKHNLNIKESK